MDLAWATLDERGGTAVLRFERRLAHPPGKVFRAISDPAELRHWFPATVEAELRPGAPIRFTFEDMDIDAPGGEVVEVDPPRLLVYTWGDDVLRWELLPDGSGTRLVFTSTIGGREDWPARLAAARNAAGWDTCLAALAARLDGEPAHELDWPERNAGYVERFGLAEGWVEDGAVRFARDIAKPAEEIWRALAGGAEPVAGEPPPAGFTDGRAPAGPVTDVDAPRRLEFDAPAGRVRWELRSLDFATGVVLTQRAPAELRPLALAAWQTHLEVLVATLHGAERRWPEGRTEALRARYAVRLEAPAQPARRP